MPRIEARVSEGVSVASALRRTLQHPALPFLVFALGVLLLAVGWAQREPNLLATAVVVLLFACTGQAVANIRASYVALGFVVSFALFLCSRLVASAVFHYPPGGGSTFGMPFNRNDVDAHVFFSLGLALVGIFAALPILALAVRHFGSSSKQQRPTLLHNVRILSLALFFAALPVQLLMDTEVAVFVQNNGYLRYYTDFHTAFPGAVRVFGGAFQVAYLTYLATNPSKRTVWLPTVVYLAEGVLSLGSGKRTEFVLSIAIVAIYVTYRHFADGRSSQWITRKTRIAAAFAVPAIVAVVGTVARLRTTTHTRHTGFLSPALEVLYAQGVSVNTVGYAYVYRAQIPHSHLYSIGPIVDLVTRRLPALVGLGPGVLAGQTVQRATTSGDFSQLISYLVLRRDYLNGAGLGSSFVAELYTDFSYVGVLVGSFLLALVVVALTVGLSRSWAVRALSLVLIRQFLLTPRTSPTSFVVTAFTASTVAGMVSILLLALLLTRLRIDLGVLSGAWQHRLGHGRRGRHSTRADEKTPR